MHTGYIMFFVSVAYSPGVTTSLLITPATAGSFDLRPHTHTYAALHIYITPHGTQGEEGEKGETQKIV